MRSYSYDYNDYDFDGLIGVFVITGHFLFVMGVLSAAGCCVWVAFCCVMGWLMLVRRRWSRGSGGA